LVEDVIWTSLKRQNSQPMESLRGLGDLQGVNEFFLFAEKRIQKKKAALHGRHDLLFKLHRNVSDPWNV